MTPLQQKEYDYRFKDRKKNANGVYIILLTVTMLSIVSSMVFSTYLIVSDDQFDYLKDSAGNTLSAAMRLMSITLIAVVIIMAYDIIVVLIGGVQEQRWRKKNKIKTIRKLL